MATSKKKCNGRRPQIKWKTTSKRKWNERPPQKKGISPEKMEDDLTKK
jgi:hypothetical protein